MANILPAHPIAPGVNYFIPPYHRNNTPQKSQWSISEVEEINAFQYASQQNWLIDNTGWGLHLVSARVQYLGTAQGGGARLFVAKFVEGSDDQNWHGYPADHQRRPADIPAPGILKQWMTANLLRRALVRKITRGQPCSL